MGRLRVDVLGPLRVRDADDRDVTPEGALQRRLFALLVLHRGRAVSADTAIDTLWPASPPRDPAAALQNHVFRLRKGLPVDVVDSTGNGYRLDPARLDVDVDRLAAAVDAREADPGAVAVIDATLDRWHGPAYPDLDEIDDGRTEAMRLEELRVRAHEARAAARLAAGATDGLVADLSALSDAVPLRERPRALLMAALVSTGRAVEALRVYDDFRRLLGDELGIEPSPALAVQHAELLAGSNVGAWVPPDRLPVPATSLVGREALLVEIEAMADRGRLITLVGPGGVGKTRLAVELGRRARASRPDRAVVLCELATAVEASAVDVVAAALAIDGRPGVALGERIAAVLGDREMVLLVDNCEHVLDPIAALAEQLLAACPNVTLVATSRERLRVSAEQVCAVPTLPSAADDGAAVELFVDRARAVRAGFTPDASEMAVIAELVRRLDGLPLAIELAAARLHTHDVGEIADGLDHRFGLLSSGYRTSTRHGSLSAAVSWSYELLDEHLQRAFTDLSVFAGAFTVDDAAAVCEAEVDGVADALQQLVERSLVHRAPDRRYVLLETLRAFGSEQLAADDRVGHVGERHAHHQLEWIERADRRLVDPGVGGLAAIDAALPELRVAFGWLLAHGDVERAGRLVAALLDYGFLRLRPDVLAWSERVIAADPGDHSSRAAVVRVTAAYAAWMAGDLAGTSVQGWRALAVSEQTGADVPAVVAIGCGTVELFEGRLDESAAWFAHAAGSLADGRGKHLIALSAEVLPLAYAGHARARDAAARLLAEVGDASTPYAAYAWYCAGEADLAVDLARARERLAKALQLAEQTNAAFVIGVAGATKASIDARHGDPHVAAADYRRLIEHWRRAGMWSTQWTMLRSIAGLLARLGRPRDAAVLEGAVRAPGAGHRIFGADATALAELGARLRTELGDEAYAAALAEGASLDGDAAIAHALRAL